MALEIKLQQKLSQTLVMTPQLQQAIRLLQLGRLEYLDVLEKELLENPCLEDISDSEAESAEGRNGEGGAASAEDSFGADLFDEAARLRNGSASDGSMREDDESIATRDLFNYNSGQSGFSDADLHRTSVETTVSAPEGLASHLLWQLRTEDISESDQEIAAQIIGNLDHNGYLCSSSKEISELSGHPEEDVERVLAVIQVLDPCGVAARNLKECLSIQLAQLGLSNSLAARIVTYHLSDLEMRAL